MNIFIGIDPSINNTGMCVYYEHGDFILNPEFYIITPKITKKQKELECKIPEFMYMVYDKNECNHEDNHINELNKTYNFMNIISKIDEVISGIGYMHKLYICMEGVSYGSSIRTKSVFDLAGLNYMIRQYLLKKYSNNAEIIIVTPSEIKKFSTGKGNADKDMIKSSFAALFPQLTVLPKYDDIADAYFMSQYVYDIFKKENEL